MAISRFYSEESTAYSLFYDFLQKNKSGTFLDNIAIEKVSDTELKLSKNDASISLIKASGMQTYFTYTNKKITKSLSAYSSAGADIRSAILCKNGLILGFYLGTANIFYNVAVTVDSTEGLSVIAQNGNPAAASANIPAYVAISESSTSAPPVTLTPQYSANLTSLAPIMPTTSDNSVILHNAYAALHTQVSGMGLQAVAIDGDNYITNGVWYIRD